MIFQECTFRSYFLADETFNKASDKSRFDIIKICKLSMPKDFFKRSWNSTYPVLEIYFWLFISKICIFSLNEIYYTI